MLVYFNFLKLLKYNFYKMSLVSVSIILIITSMAFLITLIFLTYYVSQYVKGSKNYSNLQKIKNKEIVQKYIQAIKDEILIDVYDNKGQQPKKSKNKPGNLVIKLKHA